MTKLRWGGTVITVKDVNEAFASKGIHIKLPLDSNQLVKSIAVLDKQQHHNSIRLLLGVNFIDSSGKETSDIFLCEGQAEEKNKAKPARLGQPLKSSQLPLREKITFDSKQEAKDYVKEAITHLLQDKGYQLAEQDDTKLYFKKGEGGFFITFAWCDEEGLSRIEELVELRQKHGTGYDYGLVVLAFQEVLGIPLQAQERWVSSKAEYSQGLWPCIYGVDNLDPNLV